MNSAHTARGSRRRADVLLIVGFFAILGYPSLALFEGPEAAAERARVENRMVASRPPIHKLVDDPSAFVAGFKSFFEDQFAGRGRLVTANSKLRLDLLEVSANSKVIVGKHGSLFYAGEPMVPAYDLGHEVAKQRRVRVLSEVRLRQMHEYLLSRKRWAEENGAAFLLVVAPDKTSIYPEFTPDWMAPVDAASVTDQFLGYLAEKGDVEFLDLRPALFEAKKGGQPLYHRDDTHWNQLGGFAGYAAISRRLAERFPSIRPLGPEDLAFSRGLRIGDLVAMLHLNDYVRERVTNVAIKAPRAKEPPYPFDPTPIPGRPRLPKVYQVDDPSLPKALIHHDSYMEAMQPFLAQNFQTSVFVWDFHFVKKKIEGYKPDVLIYEFVERNIPYMNFNLDDLMPAIDPQLVAEDRIWTDRGTLR